MKRVLFLPLLLLSASVFAQSHSSTEPHYPYPRETPYVLSDVISHIRNYFSCQVNGDCGNPHQWDNGTVFSWLSTELVNRKCKIKVTHHDFDLVRGQITVDGNPEWVNLFENHREHCSLTRAAPYPPWYCGHTN